MPTRIVAYAHRRGLPGCLPDVAQTRLQQEPYNFQIAVGIEAL